jgi:hypothetical protein
MFDGLQQALPKKFSAIVAKKHQVVRCPECNLINYLVFFGTNSTGVNLRQSAVRQTGGADGVLR